MPNPKFGCGSSHYRPKPNSTLSSRGARDLKERWKGAENRDVEAPERGGDPFRAGLSDLCVDQSGIQAGQPFDELLRPFDGATGPHGADRRYRKGDEHSFGGKVPQEAGEAPRALVVRQGSGDRRPASWRNRATSGVAR